ncbi:MAG: acetyl-CoA C-acyltransferase [Deltaproteobacteria bacterium]|nr:acetyl-CoA C-acyltransferase [Deltaproteobacteria bacterium]
MEEIVILSAVRTPIGAFQGGLAPLAAPRLGARALSVAMENAGVDPSDVEQVNMGCVLPAGQGQAPARQAALAAGCPNSTGALTLNKVCGSGMKALMIAANDLRCGDFELVAAGGMENMSQAPYLATGVRDGLRLGHGKLIDSMIHDGLWDPYNDIHMGNCAELCATEYNFSREAQDAFALESYRRARAAVEGGAFDAEVVTVEIPGRKGSTVIDRDEEPFRVDLDRMPSLRPAFKKDGTITAANASKINDGAAALVMSTASYAEKLGRKPLARLVAHSSAAQAPEWFTTAPVEATRQLLARAGLTAQDIDLWEVNEAFAAVAMAYCQDLGVSPEAINVNGGAVALGHPIGASGARIVVTLLHAMAARNARRGVAAICLGGGEATAVLLEREG